MFSLLDVGPTTPAQMGTLLTDAGDKFSKSSADLSAIPLPSSPSVRAEAEQIVTAFAEIGPRLAQIGTEMLGATDQRPDTTTQYLPAIQQAFQPIIQAGLSSSIDAQTQQQIDKIPECAAIQVPHAK